MREKLSKGQGKTVYSRRKVIVEPVFGQIEQGRGFRRFSHHRHKVLLVRGLGAHPVGDDHLMGLIHAALRVGEVVLCPRLRLAIHFACHPMQRQFLLVRLPLIAVILLLGCKGFRLSLSFLCACARALARSLFTQAVIHLVDSSPNLERFYRELVARKGYGRLGSRSYVKSFP